MLGRNKCVYMWRKDDTKYTLHLICSCSEEKISLMIWRCICYDSVGSPTAVEGNINADKCIDILGKNLWPVVVWYFKGKKILVLARQSACSQRTHYRKLLRPKWSNLNGIASTITRFKYHRKYLALHEESYKSAVNISIKNDILRQNPERLAEHQIG